MMILIFIAGLFTGALLMALCAASKSDMEFDIPNEESKGDLKNADTNH